MRRSIVEQDMDARSSDRCEVRLIEEVTDELPAGAMSARRIFRRTVPTNPHATVST
jgi:hypothetical protein